MEDNLLNKKCVPCTGKELPLEGEKLQQLVSQLPAGWHIKEERLYLEKSYSFSNFAEALHFTNAVGEIAEREGHHPTIILSWGKVTLQIWTHKIKGLSENDFILAAKCDQSFSKYKAIQ